MHDPPGTAIFDVAGGPERNIIARIPSYDPNQSLNWNIKRKAVQFTILELGGFCSRLLRKHISLSQKTVLLGAAVAELYWYRMCSTVPYWGPADTDLSFIYDHLKTRYACRWRVFPFRLCCSFHRRSNVAFGQFAL